MITTTAQAADSLPSKLVKRQVRTFGPVPIVGYGSEATITATVRYDDSCGNGYNTFGITAEIRSPARGLVAAGCQHDLAVAAFPELATLIKWHLMSTEGPLHYIENTMYWLGRRGYTNGKPGDPPNLDYAKKTAVWPDMPEGYVITGTVVSNAEIESALVARVDGLLAEFKAAVESLEFQW
jgi:hypothetical protein